MLAISAAAAAPPVAPFSAFEAGRALPGGWELLTVPDTRPPDVALVREAGTVVLRVASVAAAGSVAHRLSPDPTRPPMLSWRWKVDRVVTKGDLTRKAGDDYAARVYVSFDVPESSLTLFERARMRLAKLVYGAELPTAAICYIWDNRQPVGTSAWNPYTSRVRMVVLQSGGARAGQWVSQTRDVAADFRAAFGEPVRAVTGVAVSADTDQTGESVTAWFGDLTFGPRL